MFPVHQAHLSAAGRYFNSVVAGLRAAKTDGQRSTSNKPPGVEGSDSDDIERDSQADVNVHDDGDRAAQKYRDPLGNLPVGEELEDSVVAPAQVEVTKAQEFCLEAHCLLNGHGIGQHTDDALVWYRQSIDQQEPKALLAMGQMNEHGMIDVIRPSATETISFAKSRIEYIKYK